MQTLYFFSFSFLLIIPFFGIFNSIYLNKHYKTQKIFNNITYILLITFVLLTLLCYNIEGNYKLNLLNLSTGVSITFLANNFNLIFAGFLATFIFLFNLIFQNSFTFLNLSKKYILYNKPMAYLYLLYILLVFSSNIITTIFIYLLTLVFYYLFIVNPDLKELRKHYTRSFFCSFTSFIIFFIMASFYFAYFKNLSFAVLTNPLSFDINLYWLLGIAFFLICINLCGPIYLMFKEKSYYEDFLVIFVVFIFPLLLNTFLFFKILYFIFLNNFNNLGLFFNYFQYFVVALFCGALFFLIKYIKSNIKFNFLFNISNFILFFFQILFINSEADYFKILTNFILFFLSIILSTSTKAEVLFYLMKSGTMDVALIRKKSKIEILFYAFSTLTPLIINLITFFDLNFYNFNFFYLLAFFGIIILFILYIIFFIIILRRITSSKNKEIKTVSTSDSIKLFFPSIILLFVFLFSILMKKSFY